MSSKQSIAAPEPQDAQPIATDFQITGDLKSCGIFQLKHMSRLSQSGGRENGFWTEDVGRSVLSHQAPKPEEERVVGYHFRKAQDEIDLGWSTGPLCRKGSYQRLRGWDTSPVDASEFRSNTGNR